MLRDRWNFPALGINPLSNDRQRGHGNPKTRHFSQFRARHGPCFFVARRDSMIALKRILVATDFGPAADAALTYGRELATTFGATMHVIHVAENFFMRPSVADPYALKEAVVRRLEMRLTEADRTALHARAVVEISDHPADAIATYAKQNDIDLIVMGTHGRDGFTHLLMGSVAERVVRTASCPVLTVKHPEHEFVRPDAAGRQQEARPS